MAQLRRRLLTLGSLAEYRQEIERLDAVGKQRNLERAGNWSLDQCCQHLGRWIEFSIDGVGMVYASIISQRISVAATTAKVMASIHSRTGDFLAGASEASAGLEDFQNFQFMNEC